MIKRIAALGILSVVLLASCAPAGTPVPAVPTDLPAPTLEPTRVPAVPATEPPPATPSEAPAASPTSRGNALVASDPASVNLRTGQHQLIEFFAFW